MYLMFAALLIIVSFPALGMQEESASSKKICTAPHNNSDKIVSELEGMFAAVEATLPANNGGLAFEKLLYLSSIVLIRMEKERDAISCYKALMHDESAPVEIRSWAAYDLGYIAMQRGNYSDMWRYFKLSADGGYQKARVRLHNFAQMGKFTKKQGLDYYAQGNYLEAFAYLKMAQANGENVAFDLGTTCIKLKRYEEASRYFDQLLDTRQDQQALPELLVSDVAVVQSVLMQAFEGLEDVD